MEFAKRTELRSSPKANQNVEKCSYPIDEAENLPRMDSALGVLLDGCAVKEKARVPLTLPSRTPKNVTNSSARLFSGGLRTPARLTLAPIANCSLLPQESVFVNFGFDLFCQVFQGRAQLSNQFVILFVGTAVVHLALVVASLKILFDVV